MPSIVTINVSQQVPPFPNSLQQTGAMVSQGATNTAPGTVSLLTEFSDLAPLLHGALAISSITWASNTATVTTAAPHGLTNASTIWLTISGTTPAAYSGSYLCTVTGSSTFTYALTPNPGTCTVPGVWTEEDVAELNSMATTFYTQGSLNVYVLELGPGSPAAGVATLSAYIAANVSAPAPLNGQGTNPSRFYHYLVPRTWADESTFQALVNLYSGPSAMLYFHVTATLSNYTNFNNTQKDVLLYIEAPAANPIAEFDAAAGFYNALNINPGPSQRATPFAYEFCYGVTPYPALGNGALFTTLENAAVNIFLVGAEGGISDVCLYFGTTKDEQDFLYWFSVDWVQIQAKLSLANAIINGSNNKANPLYLDQNGIDALHAVLAGVFNRGVTFGLVLGTSVLTNTNLADLDQQIATGIFAGQTIINAVPFIEYYTLNQGDYAAGLYKGFTGIYTPKRGFKHVQFNLVVSGFVIT